MDSSPSAARSLAGRAAANRRWSRTPSADRPAATEAARDGWLAKLADEIDPEHRLDDDERMQLARQARKAAMQAMAAKRRGQAAS